jgi:hypothetical protein
MHDWASSITLYVPGEHATQIGTVVVDPIPIPNSGSGVVVAVAAPVPDAKSCKSLPLPKSLPLLKYPSVTEGGTWPQTQCDSGQRGSGELQLYWHHLSIAVDVSSVSKTAFESVPGGAFLNAAVLSQGRSGSATRSV